MIFQPLAHGKEQTDQDFQFVPVPIKSGTAFLNRGFHFCGQGRTKLIRVNHAGGNVIGQLKNFRQASFLAKDGSECRDSGCTLIDEIIRWLS